MIWRLVTRGSPWALILCLGQVAAAWGQSSDNSTPSSDGTLVLPDIEVIGTSPTNGEQLDRDKVPADTNSLFSSDFNQPGSSSVTDSLSQKIPGLNLSDTQGNGNLQDLNFRGFAASPLQGTPQGLAIYQNGIRINEAFGDTVNWDLIPELAIDRADLWTSNPLFGLNALGGALNLQMKNGFNFQGTEFKFEGGSFGHIDGGFQYGTQLDNFAFYMAGDALHDSGWRDFSPSTVRRFYSDVGWKNSRSEVHFNVTAADNRLGVVGPTPVELLANRYASVYTSPQTTDNRLLMFGLNGRYDLSDHWRLDGNFYLRSFHQSHVDGNDSSVEACDADDDSPYAGMLCLDGEDFPDDTSLSALAVRDQNGNLVSASVLNGQTPGSIDRTWTNSLSFGGTLQASNDGQLFGRGNHFTIGTSFDHSLPHFRANSELGTIGDDLSVSGTGIIYHTDVAGGISSVDLDTRSTDVGLFASNSYDLTDSLTATIGGRYNYATIKLIDKAGDSLNGSHSYQRFNPMAGLTYQITNSLTAYGGYSEANRAPTPLELGCADPAVPCLLEGFLVSDPALKQVVSRSWELGLRGKADFGSAGRLDWKTGLYRTNNSDDIISEPSAITGRGYYTNAGRTRRQGVELAGAYSAGRWSVYASYAYVDATYRSSLTLSSPNNPSADADGNIEIHPGNRIPGISPHQFKLGGDYALTPAWHLGADLIANSSQYYIGDDANQNKQLPGYAVVNLHSSYQLTDNIQIFGVIKNLFNHRYYSYGSYFDTGDISFLGLSDPRSESPGAPLTAYAGVDITF